VPQVRVVELVLLLLLLLLPLVCPQLPLPSVYEVFPC
jgi:hypothetical protein